MSTKRKKGPDQPIPLQTIVAVDKEAKANGQVTQLDGTQANAEHIDKAEQPLIMVNTVEDFANMIGAWHAANFESLKMMATIPGDGSLKFEFEDKEYIMEGDIHAGYRMGIYAALGMFGKLPFQEVPDDEPAS